MESVCACKRTQNAWKISRMCHIKTLHCALLIAGSQTWQGSIKRTNIHTHMHKHTHTLPLRNFFMAAECHHGATPALAAPQLCSRVFWPAAQISPLLNYEWTSWLRWVPSFPLIPPSPFFNSSKRTGATVPAVREQLNACWKGLENYGMRKGISCDGWW